MKKQILILVVLILGLSGCSSNSQMDETGANLIEEQEIQRLLSSSNVEDFKEYNFAISSEAIDGIDTYKIGNDFSITSNDNQEYSLYYSKEKDYELENIKPDKFLTYYTQEPKEGFYTLKSDENMDVIVSTM